MDKYSQDYVHHITTQYPRDKWKPEVAESHDEISACCLRVATFGWWEIIPLTIGKYDTLTAVLKAEGVHACAVTGMPVQHIADRAREDKL